MYILQVIKYNDIHVLELQSEREKRYIALSSTYSFWLAISTGFPKAHTVKTAVCNINVGFSCRHHVNQILSSHIVLNLKLYEMKSNSI